MNTRPGALFGVIGPHVTSFSALFREIIFFFKVVNITLKTNKSWNTYTRVLCEKKIYTYEGNFSTFSTVFFFFTEVLSMQVVSQYSCEPLCFSPKQEYKQECLTVRGLVFSQC